jgi:hypothetical protein
MMKTLCLALLAVGCATDPAKPSHQVAEPIELRHQPVAEIFPGALQGAVVPDDICALLPADGSCDSACDPAALASTVPVGQCYDMVCQLTDGTFYRYGGCN